MPVPSQTIQAIAISPGIAIGRVQRINTSVNGKAPVPVRITPAMVAEELRRFDTARDATRIQLQNLKDDMLRKIPNADADLYEIFETHILLVDDRALVTGVRKNIEKELWNAEYSIFLEGSRFADAMGALEDEYLRERAADIRDVASRLLENLSTGSTEEPGIDSRRIIVAPTLSPSETIRLDREKVLAFALETGSTTSHAAILARSMHIPAVAGLPGELLENLSAEDTIIIDGYSGKVTVNPAERVAEAYRLKAQAAGKLTSELMQDSYLTPETSDGFQVELAVNLESVDSFDEAKKCGACGVGLFRTEFLFMDRNSIPDEETQFQLYKSLLIAAGDDAVTIRTMDLGGDKFSTGIHHRPEENPFLGLRGIRLSLYERRDLFDTQLRALLRAGVYGNLRVMIPMVSSVIEVEETRRIIAGLQQQLTAEGIEHINQLSLGAMIETPAAALLADRIAGLVDFFSIGTNDLVQYTMAIDRGNERVAYLYRPTHPAILRLIRNCVKAAAAQNIFVSVCGQMASEPLFVPFLLGLGVNELSMTTDAIPAVRRIIRSLSRREAEEAVMRALDCNSAAESLKIAEDLLRLRAPEIFAMRNAEIQEQ